MTREEIKAAAMKASKDYGYSWVMADFEYEECDEVLEAMLEEMEEKGCYQVCIYDGEEPYYAMDYAHVDGVDLVEEMNDGDVFNENKVYGWITLGRIDAWKEVFKMEKVGYFCDGYRAYVFDPKRKNVYMLKQHGEVVVA